MYLINSKITYLDTRIASAKFESVTYDTKEIKFSAVRNLGTKESTEEFVTNKAEYSMKKTSKLLHRDAILLMDLISVHVLPLIGVDPAPGEQLLRFLETCDNPRETDGFSVRDNPIYMTGIEQKDGLIRLTSELYSMGDWVEIKTPWFNRNDDRYERSELLTDLIDKLNEELVLYVCGKKFEGSEYVQLNIWDGSFMVSAK